MGRLKDAWDSIRGVAKEQAKPSEPRFVRKIHVGGGQSFEDQTDVDEASAIASNAYLAQDNVVWIYASVSAISEDAAAVPFKLFRERQTRDGETEREEINDPEITKVIDKPNPEQTWTDLVEKSMASAELSGNFYWELLRDETGRIRRIHDVASHQMFPQGDPHERVSGYIFRDDQGKETLLPKERIAQFRYTNLQTDLVGRAPFVSAIRATTRDVLSQTWNESVFRNDGSPGVVLTTDGVLGDKEVKTITDRWLAKHGGPRRARMPAILSGGMKIAEFGIKPDMAFLELRRFDRTEILASFGVPSVRVGVLDDASYANANMQMEQYWRGTMLAKLQKFEDFFNLHIAPHLGDGIFGEFDRESIPQLREDQNEKTDREVKQVTAGLRTINEVRLENNEPPVPWGDTWWQPIGVVPAGSMAPRPGSGSADGAQPAASNGMNGSAPALLMEEKRLVYDMERRIRVTKAFRANVEARAALLQINVLNFLDKVAEQEIRALQNVVKTEHPILYKAAMERVYKITPAQVAELSGLLEEFGFAQVELGGAQAAGELGVRFVMSPAVEGSVRTILERRAGDIMASVEKDISLIVNQGISNGLTPFEISQEIAGSIGDFARAERIARTETSMSANLGIESGYRMAGADGKEWLTIQDGSQRDSHSVADGQMVPIDSSFTVGDSSLKFPGDPSGSPGEIINCRCTIAPVLRLNRRAPRGFIERDVPVEKTEAHWTH